LNETATKIKPVRAAAALAEATAKLPHAATSYPSTNGSLALKAGS
jgi:hypothetical protein